jgi:hypothetical protein
MREKRIFRQAGDSGAGVLVIGYWLLVIRLLVNG